MKPKLGLLLVLGVLCLAFPACRAKADRDLGIRFEYDSRGRLIAATDVAGQVTRFDYKYSPTQRLQKLTKNLPGGGKVTIDFDLQGRRTGMSDPAGSARYRFDGFDRLVTLERDGSPSIAFAYDTLGRLISIHVDDDLQLRYAYDFLGRRARIDTPRGAISYDYYARDGVVVRSMPKGLRTVFKYTQDRTLRAIQHVASDNQLLLGFEYEYRPDRLIRQVAEASGYGGNLVRYEYDEMHRLASAASTSAGMARYEYDTLGHLTRASGPGKEQFVRAYDWAGRLLRFNGTSASHDAAGSLKEYGAADGRRRFEYDATNRLSSAASSRGSVQYTYDGEGYLLSRKAKGKTTRFVPDPFADVWRPLLAFDERGERTLFVWEGNVPIAAIRSGAIHLFLSDHLGSVRAVASGEAARVRHLQYSAYGVPEVIPEASELQPAFAGLFYDPVAGVYLARRRAYDPQLARFLQREPDLSILGASPRDLSAYAYGRADPVNGADLTGARWEAPPYIPHPLGYSPPPPPVPAPGRRGIPPSQPQHDDGWRWWSLFDASYAKQWYAERSRQAIASAWGTGFSAGMEATAWDLIGGYIPGKAVNQGQEYGQIIWTLFPLGGVNKASQSLALTGLGVGAAFGSSLISAGEGNYAGATLDILSLHGAALGMKADALRQRGQFRGPETGQAEFIFMFPDLDKRASNAARHAERIGLFDLARTSLDLAGTLDRVLSRQAPKGESYREPLLDRLLNRFGENSNWIGRNRSGGKYSYDLDARGEFPLGDTTVQPKGELDRRARWHDIQYYVNMHAPEGQWVEVPAPGGAKEYYKSGGPSFLSIQGTNLGLLWRHKLRTTPPPEGFMTIDSVGSRYPVVNSYPVPGQEPRSAAPDRDLADQSRRPSSFFPPGGGGGGRGASAGGIGSPFVPAPVGGVALNGAAAALKHLGVLKGVAYDAPTGKWFLLAKDGDAIGLPPLRLDDLVTVFRTVYDSGESPSVSLDPNPKDPRGPLMLVRHGKGTEDTYVGWILFEADRVMKTYSLGFDNSTCEALKSSVEGFHSIVELGAAGFANGDSVWERFWITPRKVTRRQARDRRLTLLEVPLQVETRRMVWRNGELVDASNAPSSKAATSFKTWFTTKYDLIAQERLSRPPAASGIDERVAFFTELQRIALISAIAETLRNQGVPMPAWMRDYPIRTFPMPRATAAIAVQAADEQSGVCLSDTKGGWVVTGRSLRQVYGGVRLSPADTAVEEIDSPDAEALARTQWPTLAAAPLFSQVAISSGIDRYRAVPLPGRDTRDLLACKIEEADLSVAVAPGETLNLSRTFNSFFQPHDAFGGAWTLDLPVLETRRRAVHRTSSTATLELTYHIASPLNTHSFQVPDAATGVRLGERSDVRFGSPVRVVALPDGREWYFDDAGRLVARTAGAVTTIYRRDSDGRIHRIDAQQGVNTSAYIELVYDERGRMASARGNDGSSVKYRYSETGLLTRVEWRNEWTEYAYQNGLVTKVTGSHRPERRIEYDAQGHIRREWLSGEEVSYKLEQTGENYRVTRQHAGLRETIEYDRGLRPLSREVSDGRGVVAHVQWSRHNVGDTATLRLRDGDEYLMIARPGGSIREWRLPHGGTYRAALDPWRGINLLEVDGRPALRQDWLGDGRLISAAYESFQIRPQFSSDRVLTEALIGAPAEGSRFTQWLSARMDESGRVKGFKDYSGLEASIEYDAGGNLAAWHSSRGSLQTQRDSSGRILDVETSWGYREKWLRRGGRDSAVVEVSIGNASGIVEIEKSGPSRIRNFEGHETQIAYHADGGARGQIKEIRTQNGLTCKYGYDSGGRFAGVQCGRNFGIQYSYDKAGRLVSVLQVPVR